MSEPAIFIPGVSVLGVTLAFLHNVGTDEDPEWVGAPQIVNQFPRAGREVGELDHCVPVVDAPLAQSLSRGMSTQSGSVFVPKGSGVADNMRFFYEGTWYGIIGDPRWNYLHVLTGEEYGYVEFTVRKGG